LALVGDSADGYPGIAGWGAKAAASVLSQYESLENIPKDWKCWSPSVRRARTLAESLFGAWDRALLFRTLATLRQDAHVFETVDDLRWVGPQQGFDLICRRLGSSTLLDRVNLAKSKLVG
jgi:5'-3' exonuclease